MTTRTLADLSASLAATPKAMQRGQRRGVNKAALHVTRSVRREIVLVTGDNRLSGVGRRGAKVGAGYNVRGRVNPTALISARGPLHLIERDTGAHSIEPRRKRARGNRKRRAALKFGATYATAVDHPGTRGQRPFGKGVDRVKRDVAKIIEDEVWYFVRREF